MSAAWVQHRADPSAQTNTLVELMPTDAATGSIEVLRCAEFPITTASTDSPPNTEFHYLIESVPSFEVAEIPLGTFGVLSDRSEGEIVLANERGNLDAPFALGKYRWAGRWARILRGGYSPSTGHIMAVSEYHEVARLKMGRPQVGLDRVRIPVREPAKDLDRPLSQRRFRGTVGCLRLVAGDHVDFGGASTLQNLTGDLTVEAWVWIESLPGNLRLLTWDGATTWPFNFLVNFAGELRLQRTGLATRTTTGFGLELERWHHVSASCSGSEVTFRAWTPSLQREQAEVLDMGAGSVSSGDGSLHLGRLTNGFGGMVEEVRIWSEAREERQVRRLRGRPLTTAESLATQVAAYWRLDSDAGDSGSKGIHGTVAGGTFLSSLQGGEEAEGVAMPMPWGNPENVPAYLVDEGAQIYCVADDRIGAIPAAYDSGASVLAGLVHANLIAFLATPPAPGTFSAFVDGPDGSYFRLGSQPSGQVTADLEGYVEEGTGVTLDSAAEIAEHMLTKRGPYPLAASELDASSFATLEMANPSPIEYFVAAGEERTVLAGVSSILATVGAHGWFEGDLFRAERFEGVTAEAPVVDLTEVELGGSGLEPLAAEPVPWKVVLWYRRCYVVLKGDALAASLRGTARERFLSQSFRRVAEHDRELRDALRHEATVIEVESHFTQRDDAVAEAGRLLDLLGTETSQPLLLPAVTEAGRAAKRLRMLELSYADGDGVRLGLASEKFVVLGVGSRDTGSGAAVPIKVWRSIPRAA